MTKCIFSYTYRSPSCNCKYLESSLYEKILLTIINLIKSCLKPLSMVPTDPHLSRFLTVKYYTISMDKRLKFLITIDY